MPSTSESDVLFMCLRFKIVNTLKATLCYHLGPEIKDTINQMVTIIDNFILVTQSK
jgi:hypothetical protein